MTDIRPLQPEKAEPSMDVTLLGMIVVLHPATKVFDVVSIIALLPSGELKTLFSASTVIVAKLLQPEKAPLPMDVTQAGMVTEIRPVQPEKAPLPMDSMLLGMIVFSHPKINVLEDVSMMALQLFRESYF